MLTLNDLLDDIAQARDRQRAARAALEHSPNRDTIDAEKAATRELNVLLDRLLLATR